MGSRILARMVPNGVSVAYIIVTVIIADVSTGEAFTSPPRVVPKNTVARVGTSVRFNCTSHYSQPIYWSTVAFGSQTTVEIYLGENYTINGYKTSGRFFVHDDRSERRCDLVINNVEKSDAGNYFCTDEEGLGKKAYAELVITDDPMCEELSSSDDYVGDNVFGLRQDIIRFRCDLNYTGNLYPVLSWFQGQTANAIDSETILDPILKTITTQVSLVAKSNLNRVNITLTARLSTNDPLAAVGETSGLILWTSKPIYVKYAYLKQKKVKNCTGLDWTLDCNPPCLHQLEYNSTGGPSCHVTYTYGNSTYTKIFSISSDLNGLTITLISLLVVVTALCVVFIFMYIHARRCAAPSSNDQIIEQQNPLQEMKHVETSQRFSENEYSEEGK